MIFNRIMRNENNSLKMIITFTKTVMSFHLGGLLPVLKLSTETSNDPHNN